MLQITPHHRLLLAVGYVDFRRGIDGLAATCRQVLEEDPFSGTVFVFTNRRRSSIKILLFDGGGFWLCQKRFSRGRLAWWPSCQQTSSLGSITQEQGFSIKPSQLHILFSQGNPLDAPVPPDWRPVTPQREKISQPKPPALGDFG
jgi:hypothetical protein